MSSTVSTCSSVMATTLQDILMCPSIPQCNPLQTQGGAPCPQCFPREAPFPRGHLAFPSILLQPRAPQDAPVHSHVSRWAPFPGYPLLFVYHHAHACTPFLPENTFPVDLIAHCFPLPPSAPKCVSTFSLSPASSSGAGACLTETPGCSSSCLGEQHHYISSPTMDAGTEGIPEPSGVVRA